MVLLDQRLYTFQGLPPGSRVVWMSSPEHAARLTAVSASAGVELCELATLASRARLLSHGGARLGVRQWALSPPMQWRPGQQLYARLHVRSPAPPVVFLTAHFEVL